MAKSMMRWNSSLFELERIRANGNNIPQLLQVPAHAELAWLLQCYTPIGWLRKMIQFKTKSDKQASGQRPMWHDADAIPAQKCSNSPASRCLHVHCCSEVQIKGFVQVG